MNIVTISFPEMPDFDEFTSPLTMDIKQDKIKVKKIKKQMEKTDKPKKKKKLKVSATVLAVSTLLFSICQNINRMPLGKRLWNTSLALVESRIHMNMYIEILQLMLKVL